MARKPNKIKTVKVQPSVSPATLALLKELVRLGYGNTPTEAAAFLIRDGLDDRLKAGLIGPGLKRRLIREKK